MALSEFSLIQQYFSSIGAAAGVALGVGDDCAVLDVPEGEQLVVTVDTLVAGVHFPVNASPGDIAHRSLRVNLSDIAAMGAEPCWFTLALTLPEASEHWVKAFSQALADDASAFGCALVGGDTTAGPLTISIQLFGVVPKGKALTRSGAQVGDSIFVTGSLGEGAAALLLFDTLDTSVEAERDRLFKRFYRPEPRLEEGLLLRGLASAAIDISDGLIADLGHIIEASGLGADVEIKRLPIEPWLACLAEASQVTQWALSGGDDYELCFTVPEKNCGVVASLISQGKLLACCIGKISRQSGIRCFDGNGNLVNIVKAGYQHFRDS